MCMTSLYMFLTCIISGPKSPKQGVDVFLQPLVDELKILWEYGENTYDVSVKQNFLMRAALLWIANGFLRMVYYLDGRQRAVKHVLIVWVAVKLFD